MSKKCLLRLPGTGVYTECSDVAVQWWDAAPRRNGVVRFALCRRRIKFNPADDVVLARIAKGVAPSAPDIAHQVGTEWPPIAQPAGGGGVPRRRT